MQFLRDKGIAIVGYAELKNQRRGNRLPLELVGEVFQQLIDRTRIDPNLIDGLVSTMTNTHIHFPYWTNNIADYLGLSLRYAQVTDLGGATTTTNVANAAMALQCGAAEVVLCMAADAPSTLFSTRLEGHQQEFLAPAGFAGPPQIFALVMSAYAHRYGSPDKGLARLAVAQRKGAQANPNAVEQLRKPITEQDYLESKAVSSPLRMLDSVMGCDGANCLLMMRTEKAKALGFRNLVHPVGFASCINFDPQQTVPAEEIWRSGFSIAGPRALELAQLKPAQIDMLHAYDDFLIAVLLQLEQIGFCKDGEAARFLIEHDTSYDGDFPINTSGGMISAGQSGFAGGGTVLTEAVRQLMGKAGERQVRKADNAVVTGIGNMQYARNWGGSAVLVLERA
jgi:acetyl-CoA acetyltransferase